MLVRYRITTNNVPPRHCANELRQLLPSDFAGSVAQGPRGVECMAPATIVGDLANLTLPERVYAIVSNVPATELPAENPESTLAALKEYITESDGWTAALQAHHCIHPSTSVLTFAVKAERHGRRFKKVVSSMALGGSMGSALNKRFGWKVDLSNPMLEVTAALNDDTFCVSIALLRRLDSVEWRAARRSNARSGEMVYVQHAAYGAQSDAGFVPPPGIAVALLVVSTRTLPGLSCEAQASCRLQQSCATQCAARARSCSRRSRCTRAATRSALIAIRRSLLQRASTAPPSPARLATVWPCFVATHRICPCARATRSSATCRLSRALGLATSGTVRGVRPYEPAFTSGLARSSHAAAQSCSSS